MELVAQKNSNQLSPVIAKNPDCSIAAHCTLGSTLASQTTMLKVDQSLPRKEKVAGAQYREIRSTLGRQGEEHE